MNNIFRGIDKDSIDKYLAELVIVEDFHCH